MGEIDALFSSRVQVMTAWETTWGTPVTVADEVGLCAACEKGWSPEQNFFVGTGQHSSIVNWVDRTNYDFTLRLHPQGGYGLAAMLYTDLTGTADFNVNGASAGETLYKFLYTDASSGILHASPASFSMDAITRQSGTDVIERYTSAFCRTGTITIPSTGAWEFNLGCGASDADVVDAEGETYVQPTLEPFLGSKTCVTINSVEAANLENITITVDGSIRDAFTFCNSGAQKDAHREDIYHGISAELTMIQIDKSNIEAFRDFSNIGDIIITYDNSSSTEKRMAKLTLKNCKITSPRDPVGMDNAIILETLTAVPTWDGVNDPIEFLYSTATTGGYVGW